MTDLFLSLFNRAVAAGWLVLAVLVLRLLLKKAPKWTRLLLWGLVAVRLLCPFTLESVWSLIPSAQTIAPEALLDPVPTIHSGISALNTVVNPILEQSSAATPEYSVNPFQIWIAIAAAIWVVGVGILLLYAICSYVRLRKRISTAIRVEGNLYRSERTSFPFVLGVIHPKIYLPVNLDKNAMAYVIAHEQAHIHRRDHWWKLLGFLLLTVYWFHPLLWVAYVLLCRDIELACDEKVIGDMDREQRADYSQALLQCSIRRSTMAACPLAFGEVGVMERVKNVLNYRKPAFWVIVTAVAACLIAALCFLTDPVTANVKYPWVREYTGRVDTAYFESISPDFAIGAAENGQAVFKDPEKAFAAFTDLYADTLEQLRQDYDLPPITEQEYEWYKTFGWQFPGGTETERERAAFVSKFLDLYENSFIDSAPSEIPSTKQSLDLEDVIPLSEKGDALTWADFENFAYTEVGSGMYIRYYEIDETFSLMIGGPSPDEPPWYINLHAGDSGEDILDIRTGNVQSFIEANQPAWMSTVLCTYTREYAMEPSVTFYDDGTYIFCFSGLSSTLGYGTYSLSGDRLTLLDNAGGAFEFTVEGETLTCYWIASRMDWSESAAVWLANLPEHMVFTRTDGDADAWEAVLSLARQRRAAELVQAIAASPAEMSSVEAYLTAHPAEYEELVSIGADTLRYAFDRFLLGGETGLEGHILAEACQDILVDLGMYRTAVLYVTGQGWFDEFRENTLRLAEQYSEEELQEQYPASWLLLEQMEQMDGG